MAETSRPLVICQMRTSEPKASILLVDDNPANLLSLRALLEDLDQNLVEACSGAEAIERVKAEEFAVILLDVLMPGIDGFETAKMIRSEARSQYTPVIFLTATDIDRSQMEKGYTLGAVDFLVKPVFPLAIQSKVRGFVQLFQDKQRTKNEANQLRLLVQGTSEYAIFMLDPQGRIITWNTGAERLKGYQAEEIIGQHFSRFYLPDAIKRNWPEHELEVASKEGRFEDEGWRVRKDSTLFWADVVITALRDEKGDLQGFSKVTRDLTARKQAEESLHRSEERFRLLVEGAKDYAIFLLDPQGNVASWNAGAERIKQYQAAEIIGQHFSRFYTQDAVDRGWPTHELTVARAEGRFEDEGWRVRKDGTLFWANVVITALHDKTGTFWGFSKITRDLTERKKSEDNARRVADESTARRFAEENARVIQEQRERLRVTLASIGDAVISTDANGRVDFLNPVAEELVGWATAEAAGRNLEDVFQIVNEHSRQPVENPAMRALRDGKIVGLANHTILISKAGTERPIDDSAAPIRDTAGNVVGSVLVFRDISERKRSEAALKERLRLLTLNSAVGVALVQTENLRLILQQCAEAVVEHLHGAFARIWTLNRQEDILELQASAGLYTHLDGPHSRVPVGQYKIGLIAKERKPHFTNAVVGDPRVNDQEWAKREGMVSFAGFPLLVDGRLVGVMAMFAREHLSASTVEAMASVANGIALGIERKIAEEEVLQSERRFRQLADAMPQIVWTARPDGKIDYQNRHWHEFTGLAKTIDNDGWAQILHPNDAQTVGERWGESLRSGNLFEMEARLLDRRRQTYRWHLVRAASVFDESGKVTRWFGTSTDIHEQKRAEESAHYLAEASAALAGVVDYESTLQKVANLAVPYFADWSAVDIANDDGTLRRLAAAHQDVDKIRLLHELMRQYPPDPQSPSGSLAVLHSGKPLIVSEITEELLMKEARDERHAQLIRLLRLKSYICVPLIVSGKSLGVLTFATAESGRNYTDADLALAIDLANRAAVAIENTQLYQALREGDRRKDEFLATLAHELRNPLAPIRNALQILKMPRIDARMVEKSRDMMERQVHHLVRLVDDLLDVSRVMRGKIELRRERIELATVVARAVETVQPLLDVQGHELTVVLPKESIPLDADPVRLAQIVGNLLTNAAKYTEPKGHIRLTAERNVKETVLRVQDNGIGIAADILPRIFELFVQVDHASTRSQGGLGIGLTLVKNLCEMHNGSVEARSAGLGKGSEFIVRLPISSQGIDLDQNGAMESQAQIVSMSGHRVLIVDDNQDAADSLAILLRLQGHEVRVALSGAAALETTNAYVPDMVFLDIGMPGMDGYEVAHRLRQQPGLENVVLVALTGWGQQENRRRTAEAGFNHHLVKPPEPKAVENLLADLKRPAVS